MSAAPALAELETITDRRRAAAVMHPLRPRILHLAATPSSATELAGQLRLPRQVVNYHVRELARARFLKRAGQRKKRNLIEQRWVATARAYVFAPDVLGPAAPDWRRIQDAMSAEYLAALAAQVQSDLGAITAQAAAAGKRLSTLSLHSELRFENAEQRARFADALHAAVLDVIARHAAPASKPDGTPGSGRPYRLMLGCYPAPSIPSPDA
jgi:hypothetical protein